MLFSKRLQNLTAGFNDFVKFTCSIAFKKPYSMKVGNNIVNGPGWPDWAKILQTGQLYEVLGDFFFRKNSPNNSDTFKITPFFEFDPEWNNNSLNNCVFKKIIMLKTE